VTDPDVPPGWRHNPSEWRRRLPVLGLTLLGCGIASYLALYQVGVVRAVWEPFFGTGSSELLRHSFVARLLPIPDAALGALAYLLEAGVDLVGGRARWRTAPWAVLLLGLLAAGMGVGNIGLVILQPLLAHTFCTLCLASAVCSLLVAAAVSGEVWAALQHLRAHRRGERGV
jgi:uncharacterized membrane protein